jgi:hypothetical protein
MRSFTGYLRAFFGIKNPNLAWDIPYEEEITLIPQAFQFRCEVLCMVEGDQLMIALPDFINMQESPVTFISIDSDLAQALLVRASEGK